jgi:hypothetical protein
MKRLSWQKLLGLSLIVLSAIFYFTHYVLFRDAHHIFIFLLGDIAFVPIEVLLVTLIIHRVLGEREKKALLEKLNMLIGAFFSELGIRLVRILSGFDSSCGLIREAITAKEFSGKEFPVLKSRLKGYSCQISLQGGDLKELKQFLSEKRGFLLSLLENPNLFEHDTFTDLLWAVFHLAEELSYREDLADFPPADARHIENDMKRVYDLILYEWLDYMKHLRDNYPYLFSLAVRTNPFDLDAKAQIST